MSLIDRGFRDRSRGLASAALVDPALALRLGLDRREQVRDEIGPLVVFTVAVAVLLTLSVVMSLAGFIYCARKGGSFEWAANSGWQIWDVKLACRLK